MLATAPQERIPAVALFRLLHVKGPPTIATSTRNGKNLSVQPRVALRTLTSRGAHVPRGPCPHFYFYEDARLPKSLHSAQHTSIHTECLPIPVPSARPASTLPPLSLSPSPSPLYPMRHEGSNFAPANLVYGRVSCVHVRKLRPRQQNSA